MATTHTLNLRANLDTSQVKREIEELNSQGSVSLDASGINTSINKLNSTIAKFTSSLEALSKNVEKTSNSVNQTNQLNYGRLAKFGVGLASHQLAGAASDYLKQSGHSGTAETVAMLGRAATNISMGAAVGGFPGAALAAAVTAVIETFNALNEQAVRLKESFAKYEAALDNVHKLELQRITRLQDETLQRYVQRGDIESIRELLDKAKAQKQESEETINAFQRKYGNVYGAMATDESKVDETTQEIIDYKKALLTADKASEQIQKLQSIIDAFDKQAESNYKAYVAAQEKLNAEWQKEADYREQIEEAAAEEFCLQKEKNDKIIRQLSLLDEQLAESDEITNILQQNDIGALSETLTRYQSLAEEAYAKYQSALESGDGELADKTRKEWLSRRNQVKTLESGLLDTAKSQLATLNEAVMPRQADPLNSLAASGISMGWKFTENTSVSIDDNVQKIYNKMDVLIETVRRISPDTGTYL